MEMVIYGLNLKFVLYLQIPNFLKPQTLVAILTLRGCNKLFFLSLIKKWKIWKTEEDFG